MAEGSRLHGVSGRRAPLLLRLFWEAVQCLFVVGSSPFFHVRIENRPRLAEMGPVILAPNHVSYLDPPALQRACREHVTFLMTDRIYGPAVSRWFFRLWGAIPVPEEGSAANAIKEALRAIRSGRPVVIFPEGRISNDGYLNEGRGGVAMILAKGNVPVIPVAILGTYEVLPRHAVFPRRGPVTVRFGEPIQPPEKLGRDGLVAFAEQVMDAIHELGAPRRPT